MKRILVLATAIALAGAGAVPATAQEVHRDRAVYVKAHHDAVLKQMIERDKKLREEAQKKTQEIIKKIKEEQKKERENRKRLRFDMSAIPRPSGPAAFEQVWHFPPIPQYLSGTCWDFSATSFLESEIKRLTGQKIKLSEMWTAYWEYVEKAKGYIRTRGNSEFGQGSESNAVTRIYTKYGVVPESAYEGVLAKDGRIDHDKMASEMLSFLKWCKANNYWDERLIIPTIRKIMDLTMGRPPETVEWKGESYTPRDFLTKVCRLHPADYVSFMSTMSVPFWTRGEYKVPDNWWHDKSYINVPLNVWYKVIVRSIKNGYSMVIGGDVSEPGYYGKENIAVIPTFDIPDQFIDQSAREFRIANRTTQDDHGIHLVGYTHYKGHDWFLIKDSARSSRWGPYKGYYMYRDDYVKLKMLTFTVSSDAVKDIIAKVDANEATIAKEAAAKAKAAKKNAGAQKTPKE